MEIFANHAHVFPKEVREDGCVDSLLSVMEKTNIAKAVCFAPFCKTGQSPNPNRLLYDEIRSHPELTGFGIINMAEENVEDQIEEIACLGFPGIKMHPQYQKFRIDENRAMRAYKKAEELNLFISFHTGVHWARIRDSKVLLFDEVSYFNPKLRFSMEHVGGYSFFNEAIAVMQNNENVYAGLTSIFDNDADKVWYLSPDKLRDLFRMVGAKRCIFGLDFPYKGADKINMAIKSIMELPISSEDKKAVLGGNLHSILGV